MGKHVSSAESIMKTAENHTWKHTSKFQELNFNQLNVYYASLHQYHHEHNNSSRPSNDRHTADVHRFYAPPHEE